MDDSILCEVHVMCEECILYILYRKVLLCYLTLLIIYYG